MAVTTRSRGPSSVSILVCVELWNFGCIVTDVVKGTTNSAVAIMEGKTPRIIENSEGIDKRSSSVAVQMLTRI